MSATFPTTPAAVPDVSHGELVDEYHLHIWGLVTAHHGTGAAAPAEVLAQHAVAALAVQHALAERILRTRWVNVRDALTYGATLDDVAAAMGFDPDDVPVGLARWAGGQLCEHLMTRAEYDTVLELVVEDGGRR